MKMENASPGRIILKLDKGYSKNTTAISATLNIRRNIFVSFRYPFHFSQPKKYSQDFEYVIAWNQLGYFIS